MNRGLQKKKKIRALLQCQVILLFLIDSVFECEIIKTKIQFWYGVEGLCNIPTKSTIKRKSNIDSAGVQIA